MKNSERRQAEKELGRSFKPMKFRLSGPKRFFRYPDSVHILEFRQLEFEMERYRNSVPITLAELHELRDAITEWIGDDYGPRATAG